VIVVVSGAVKMEGISRCSWCCLTIWASLDVEGSRRSSGKMGKSSSSELIRPRFLGAFKSYHK